MRLSARPSASCMTLASLAASFAVLAGCACCGPSEGADEGSPLLADATGPAAAAPSGASSGVTTGQVKLADLSTEPALRDALMQVAASFADIHRRYQGLNTFSTHGTQGAFKGTLEHLRKEKLASFNPDQDKDLQKTIGRLLDRNSSSGQRFISSAAAEWQRAPKTDIQVEELELLDQLDKKLEEYRRMVAAAEQNPSLTRVVLTEDDLWEVVYAWRSYIAASGTPGFDPSAKF